MDSTNLTVTFKNRKMKEEHTHEKKINHFSLFYIIYIYIYMIRNLLRIVVM